MLCEVDNFYAKWRSISMGDEKFSICATERDDKWKVSMTNLIEIWTEELDQRQVLQKCEKLNPSLSIEDVDVHGLVRKILQDIPNHITKVSVEQIKLSRKVEGGIFQFAIDFTAGTSRQFWQDVVMPLCLAADELTSRQAILLDLIKKKDAEISEYKLNGAELVRKHIRTEAFHDDVFRKHAPTPNAESCHDAFQRIMELQRDVAIKRRSSICTQPTKTCIASSLVETVTSATPNDETKSKSCKRFRHTLLSVEGPARKKRRRCVECYRKRRQSGLPATHAASLTKQVKTYCNDCSEKPHLCLPCFNSIHENIRTEIPNIQETSMKIELEEHPDDNIVVNIERSQKIIDNPTRETVDRQSNTRVPKIENNSFPETWRLPESSQSHTQINDNRKNTPKRTQSVGTLPTKRTKKNIHDFIQ